MTSTYFRQCVHLVMQHEYTKLTQKLYHLAFNCLFNVHINICEEHTENNKSTSRRVVQI